MGDSKDKQIGPKPPDPDKQPLSEQEIEVTTTPNGRDLEAQQRAQKVKQKVKKQVREAVKKAAPGGSKKQFEAADEAVDEARDKVNRRQAEKIKVSVRGKDGHGDKVERTREVKPKEK